MSDAQSASLYTFRPSFSVSFLLKHNPCSAVPLRYLNTCFTVFQCCSVGQQNAEIIYWQQNLNLVVCKWTSRLTFPLPPWTFLTPLFFQHLLNNQVLVHMGFLLFYSFAYRNDLVFSSHISPVTFWLDHLFVQNLCSGNILTFPCLSFWTSPWAFPSHSPEHFHC